MDGAEQVAVRMKAFQAPPAHVCYENMLSSLNPQAVSGFGWTDLFTTGFHMAEH